MDSGATDIYLKESAPLQTINYNHNPIRVTIPNGKSMVSSASTTIPISRLPKEALSGYIIPGLNKSLISVTKLCAAGCNVLFSDDECIVTFNGNEVLRGRKHDKNGLWYVPLLPDTSPTNYIFSREDRHFAGGIHQPTSMEETVKLRAAAPSSDSVGGYVFMWIVGLCCGWASGRLVIRYMRSCESERMTWSHTKSLRMVELVFEGLCGQRT